MLNGIQPAEEVKALRQSLQRDYPFGSSAWVNATAARLGLSLRGRGRPRKSNL
jgi:hypothetical protein